MKLVTFARPVAPHGVGDTRLVPDHEADRLEKAGDISAAEIWPPSAPPAEPVRPQRPILSPTRPAGSPDRRRTR